jgi:2-dehydropantoate 2-reductase
MRIAVFGTGGLGGYFGGLLVQGGEEVTFIARGDNLQALKTSGLRMESNGGGITLNPVNASSDTSAVGAVDLVLVTVKNWQLKEAISQMHPLVGNNTVLLPLENGVDAPGELEEAFGVNRVLAGLARVFTALEAPGVIRYSKGIGQIVFGELDNVMRPRTQDILNVFQHAGINASIPLDIHKALWEKFIFIAASSGVGSLVRAPLGVLRTVPETRAMLKQAILEGYEVALARGITLDDEYTNRTFAFLDKLSPDDFTSMQRDVMLGRPSELHSLNGAVLRLGKMYGIPTPLHEFIYNCLLPLELKARGILHFPGQPE